ncbi:MAG: hypothetical protein JNK07_07530 [Alphaproteobacteria bacterium]|nr:hypothetical protein [Alphaproteobacteria bacterium]
MSKRNLFVSFAESDGGHSYLAARAMLEPSSVAHLIFRTSVADTLDAVTSGQANFAVVPAYNTITQWEGATLKALASGQFEIYAQVCMPTSYVLVAHKDYMQEFVNTYISLREPGLEATAEDAAKIYTRFLTRIFVGAQADEQYRGRLVRPDLKHAAIELSRNPLRILEEMSRSELLKALAAQSAVARNFGGGFGFGGYQQGPLPSHVSGGSINVGTAPVMSAQPITVGPAPQPMALMDSLQAPAALVAAGLLDAPGDPEGWDQPGSLGEIVSLLRKLLVLLNVYSFGAPDLPENKTQYLLIGRRGQPAPVNAVRAPAAAPTRIMTLVRPSGKKSSADLWLRPRELLTRRARDHGYVFDRPPLMLSPGSQRAFLFEGGKPKDGVSPNPLGLAERFVDWLGSVFAPAPDAKEKAKAPDKSLRKAIEKKQEGKPKDDSPEKFDVMFLGQYQTWCVEPAAGNSCWCCEEAHVHKHLEESGVGLWPLTQFLVAALVALTALALIITPIYCTMTGACWSSEPQPTFEPRVIAPPPAPTDTATAPAPTVKPAAPVETVPRSAYPGVVKVAPPPSSTQAAPPVVTPKVEAPRPPPVFHVAFRQDKANLLPDAMGAIASAAAQALQTNRPTNIRVFSIEGRENDSTIWPRRVHAVKDELVRLGVPSSRIRYEGSGPYLITIRSTQPQRPGSSSRRSQEQYLDAVPDPMSGEF